MSTVLERAKSLQAKVANETQCWIRLDLLEGLIAEIEHLRSILDMADTALVENGVVAPQAQAQIRAAMEGK